MYSALKKRTIKRRNAHTEPRKEERFDRGKRREQLRKRVGIKKHHCKQDGKERDDVNDTFDDDGAERRSFRNPFKLPKRVWPDNFTHPRQKIVHHISDHHGGKRIPKRDVFLNGDEKILPSPCTNEMAEDASDDEIKNPYEVNPPQRYPNGVKVLPSECEVHEQRHKDKAEGIPDIGFGVFHRRQKQRCSLMSDGIGYSSFANGWYGFASVFKGKNHGTTTRLTREANCVLWIEGRRRRHAPERQR